ncbi:hypothetical protein GCM10010324_13630 [Streptomyces hiroshimensis]|uniref:Uncharacterized protein n=1 Tax=Streptomyces hiroshimensis TaxID=66424 RepID=A0ABQ2Y749_9ACTN|nr:hypothetical protein GCM10010324_13630 [Streptomyces hiroshimensis]
MVSVEPVVTSTVRVVKVPVMVHQYPLYGSSADGWTGCSAKTPLAGVAQPPGPRKDRSVQLCSALFVTYGQD